MKHPRHLLPLLVLVGSFASLLSLRAADDASHLAAAVELLKVMHSDRIIDNVADQVSQGADRMLPAGHTSATPEEEAAFRESLHKSAKDILVQQVNWATLEPLMAQMYVQDFTETEIKQLIEFYKTPVGQKLLEQQPDLAKKFSMITQQKIRGVIPVITKELRADIQKFMADHPAKPAPGPAAAPVSPLAPVPSGGPAPAASITATPVPSPTASPSPSPVK